MSPVRAHPPGATRARPYAVGQLSLVSWALGVMVVLGVGVKCEAD